MDKMWLLYAVFAAILAGIPSFILKVAAQRKYNSEVFIFFGALASIIILIPTALIRSGVDSINWGMMLVALVVGFFAALGSIFRIHALCYVDTTIYYPLEKLFSPAVVIAFGVTLFSESFTGVEWAGLLLGILVPLLLVTKKESKRQNNLLLGIVLVLVTGAISALVSALGKYVSGNYQDVLWIVTAVSSGVLMGSFLFALQRKGFVKITEHLVQKRTKSFVFLAMARGAANVIAYLCYVYSFVLGGPLVIVHTVYSLYILIPIVLSIIYYKEHWNLQKVSAIGLSFVALFLLQ